MWTRKKKTESQTHFQWEEDNLFFSRNLLDFRRHRKCNLFSAHFSNCLHHFTRTAETRELSPTSPATLPSRLFMQTSTPKFMTKQRHKCSKTMTQRNRASNRPKPWTEISPRKWKMFIDVFKKPILTGEIIIGQVLKRLSAYVKTSSSHSENQTENLKAFH